MLNVRIIPDSLSRRYKKVSGIVQLEQQRHRTGTSRSHTPNIILASLAGRVWCTKFQSSLPNVYFRFSGFDSRSYLFTSATRVRIGVHSTPKYGTKTIRHVIMTLHFRYRRAQLRSVTEITSKSRWLCVNRKSYPSFAPAQKLSGIV